MMNHKEKIKEKKATRIFYSVAIMSGVAIGMFALSMIFPFIYESSATNAMQALFTKYGVLLIIYCLVMIVIFMYMRKHVLWMHTLMQFAYLPTVALMFGMEAYEILTP